MLVADLPVAVVALLQSLNYKGGPLLAIRDINNIKAIDVKKTMWIPPFLKASPRDVPSGYYIADVLLQADISLTGSLLKIPEGKKETKRLRALAEAAKIKKVMGHLRYMCRPNKASAGQMHQTSPDVDIQELKSLVIASGRRNGAIAARAGQVDEEDPAIADAGLEPPPGDRESQLEGDRC